CEQVRGLDPGYPGLAPTLATTYVNLGKAALARDGSPATALDYFERALAASPGDAEAARQRDWAQAYQDGEAALANREWQRAAEKLEPLYAAAPDYLNGAGQGGVRHLLYTAALNWGRALLDDRNYLEAR